MDARKLDTRRKIQLGGLIVKAGLAEEPAAVLLGSCSKRLKSGPDRAAMPPASAGKRLAKLNSPPPIAKSKPLRAMQEKWREIALIRIVSHGGASRRIKTRMCAYRRMKTHRGASTGL